MRAKMAARVRLSRPRRFSLCVIRRVGDKTEPSELFCGFRNNDGTAVLLRGGIPYGHYASVDSAYARVKQVINDEVWLVWTEPDLTADSPTVAVAFNEPARDDEHLFVVTLPFIACGPVDARLHAIDIVDHLFGGVPELIREIVQIYDAENARSPLAIYCPTEGCTKIPYHSGPHEPQAPAQPADTATADDSAPDAVAPEEPTPDEATAAGDGPANSDASADGIAPPARPIAPSANEGASPGNEAS